MAQVKTATFAQAFIPVLEADLPHTFHFQDKLIGLSLGLKKYLGKEIGKREGRREKKDDKSVEILSNYLGFIMRFNL